MHTVYIGIVISFFTFFIYLLFYNFQPVVAIRSLVTGAVLLILYNLVLLVPETPGSTVRAWSGKSGAAAQ